VVFSHRRLKEFSVVGVQPSKRAFLVGAHEPAVADDVRRENGGYSWAYQAAWMHSAKSQIARFLGPAWSHLPGGMVDRVQFPA
jgi:hypothetical protein